ANALVSNHVPLGAMLPSTLKSPTTSGICRLLVDEFNDVELACRLLIGVPLNAAKTPLTCQSLPSAPATLPYPPLLRHGSWYTKPSCRLWRRSNPAGPQLRQSSLGVFHRRMARPSLSSLDESFIALLRVYAPLINSPCVNGLFSDTCSELYFVFRRWPQELMAMTRPSEANGRLGVPPPS